MCEAQRAVLLKREHVKQKVKSTKRPAAGSSDWLNWRLQVSEEPIAFVEDASHGDTLSTTCHDEELLAQKNKNDFECMQELRRPRARTESERTHHAHDACSRHVKGGN